MKAILVVCVPVCHIDFSPEKAVASPNLGCFPGSVESPGRDQPTPPFWTWFIENPRERGQPANTPISA